MLDSRCHELLKHSFWDNRVEWGAYQYLGGDRRVQMGAVLALLCGAGNPSPVERMGASATPDGAAIRGTGDPGGVRGWWGGGFFWRWGDCSHHDRQTMDALRRGGEVYWAMARRRSSRAIG